MNPNADQTQNHLKAARSMQWRALAVWVLGLVLSGGFILLRGYISGKWLPGPPMWSVVAILPTVLLLAIIPSVYLRGVHDGKTASETDSANDRND